MASGERPDALFIRFLEAAQLDAEPETDEERLAAADEVTRAYGDRSFD